MAKVIKMQGKTRQNTQVQYADLIVEFMSPFRKELDKLEYLEDIYDLAIYAWNFGNLSLILPEHERERAFNEIDGEGMDLDLLKRMVDHKIINYKEHLKFIVDSEFQEKKDELILSVVTQEPEAFLESISQKITDIDEDEFDENFINRSAIIIRPLQPFVDWGISIYPEDEEELKEINTYLISEEIDDIEEWLRKNYKKIFEFELESWYTNKKAWPQRRNYKMFKEWFQADLSIMVYDFEKTPVSKSKYY